MADMSGSNEDRGLGLTAKNMVRMLPEPMKRDDGTAAMARVAGCPGCGAGSTTWPGTCWTFWRRTWD